MDWSFLALLGGGAAMLAARRARDSRQAGERAAALGLGPCADLTHLPAGLGATALWRLSDGGFESALVRGTLSRGVDDIELTAFDLETLRERRGEWAYLPVERPFRLRGRVTVAVCEVPGPLPHLLCKRDGRGDELAADDRMERELALAKSARMRLGLSLHHAAELPPGLVEQARAVPRSEGWRAYAGDELAFATLLEGGLEDTLARVQMRDLVIELVDHALVAYPATRDALGVDGFAELCNAAAAVAGSVRRALSAGALRGPR